MPGKVTPEIMAKVRELKCEGCRVSQIAIILRISRKTVDKYLDPNVNTKPKRADYGKPRKDLKGQKFGKLLVIKASDVRGPKGQFKWECQCDCGAVTTVYGGSLSRGGTKSCGNVKCQDSSKRGVKGPAHYKYKGGYKNKGSVAYFNKTITSSRSDCNKGLPLLTPAEVLAEKYANHNKHCDICNELADLVTDHDSNTGNFRGFLCNNCNLFLGNAQHDTGRLQNAIAYLANCQPTDCANKLSHCANKDDRQCS